MSMNRVFSRAFLESLFIKQNSWHKYGVLGHTLKVTYHCIEAKDYSFVMAGLLHDIGKPYSAYQDEKDVLEGTYSFTNHEELSYQIIKSWPFITAETKKMVRYHYLIRDIKKSKKKGKLTRHKRLLKTWDSLDPGFKEKLERFLKYDDLGKQ